MILRPVGELSTADKRRTVQVRCAAMALRDGPLFTKRTGIRAESDSGRVQLGLAAVGVSVIGSGFGGLLAKLTPSIGSGAGSS